MVRNSTSTGFEYIETLNDKVYTFIFDTHKSGYNCLFGTDKTNNSLNTSRGNNDGSSILVFDTLFNCILDMASKEGTPLNIYWSIQLSDHEIVAGTLSKDSFKQFAVLERIESIIKATYAESTVETLSDGSFLLTIK